MSETESVHKLRLMKGGHGDLCLAEWTEDQATVDYAREQFRTHVRSGCMAFRMDGPGEQTLVREFDPSAREILIVPAIRGG